VSATSVVLHGHFYQPPRESPWTDRVPREVSAGPFHDWNQRILAECYRPVTEARILDREGRIRDVVNTLEFMSWDGGPTLMRWLAREAPATYARYLEADARSLGRLGFGNAVAAPYHHIILPLASRRDKVTEVRWGIADFRRRFGREPEGMWLPETAVDTETLDVLAQEGIAFTILAPDQVVRAPAGGRPGRVALPGGRSITVFVYDGALSHGVAFGSLLADADAWIRRVAEVARAPTRELVALATDGETFGHHHQWSDLALAATLSGLETRREVRLENFASFLSRHSPVDEVKLVEPSSWSCAHGVERWRSECGCKMAPQVESSQAWRAVLRDVLDDLADEIHARYEREAGRHFDDVWAVRDAFGATLDAGDEARHAFVRAHAALGPEGAEGSEGNAELRALLGWLDAEHDALRMFTSCGWFFDDLAGLEPLQVLRYAAHALDLMGERGGPLEHRIRAALAEAQSNDAEAGDGRRLWDERVRGDRASTSVAVPEPMPEVPGSAPPRGPGAREVSEGGAFVEVPEGPELPEAHEGRELPEVREVVTVSDLATVGDGPLVSAVRAFLRAPGPPAVARVAACTAALGPTDHAERVAARSLFAREVPRAPGAPEASLREVALLLGFSRSFFAERLIGGRGPVGFVFGLHLHQPVGNFDEVFRSHTDEVYQPFLERLAERELLPLTLHVSGPLLAWLDAHGHAFLDRIGRLVADGSVELLLSGRYEPVLPALARVERVEQIAWMRSWIEARFGVRPAGLWLTERVWEPDLVEDLAAAEVRYAFVDDRHFLVAGHPRHALHRPHVTESGGSTVTLLPIDEHLRYLVPFRPPAELECHLRTLRAEDHPLAILADDGEKFGGWPGTAEWVWRSGWIESFLDTLTRLVEDDVVEMLSAGEAVDAVDALGPSYLPSGSYREMEGWSLPAPAAVALESIAETVGEAGAAAAAARFLRGGHWRNFLAIYPESGRMHRKARRLAELCRARHAPEAVRHALGRARCNDAYWHGVFGGLYLAHLRAAVWANLAEVEQALRADEGLALERIDGEGNGASDLWIHASTFSCVVSPSRGGALTEWTLFAERRNLADVLTRRWQAYHRAPQDGAAPPPPPSPPESEQGGGMPSIHEMEHGLSFSDLPPLDLDERTLSVERVLAADLDAETYARADYEPIRTWGRDAPDHAYEVSDEAIEVAFSFDGRGALEKRLTVHADGSLEIAYSWNPGAFPPDAWFAPEFSVSRPVDLETSPEPGEVRRYEIRTVSKSERGAEDTVQGFSVTPMWPCRIGHARVCLRP
jgi:alpha-amylase/alpha-mannosidase (GH57 family)